MTDRLLLTILVIAVSGCASPGARNDVPGSTADAGSAVEGRSTVADEADPVAEADQAAHGNSGETVADATTDGAFPAHIEDLLEEADNAPTLEEAPRCISVHRIRSTDVIDSRHVAFRMTKNEYYLAELEKKCVGLDRRATITYASTGHRLCKRDGIRAIIKYGPTASQGPRCLISDFIPVTKDYLDMVRDQLRQQ